MDSSQGPSFQSRSNLNRTLEFRPHLKYFACLAGALFVLAEAMMLLLFSFSSRNFFSGPEIIYPLGISAVLALYFILLGYLIKDFSKMKVHVRPEQITVETGKKSQEIKYSEIEKLNFSFVPYIGGWFQLVMKDQAKHKFSVVLERSEYLLESILSHRPDLTDARTILRYRRTAIYSDHSWSRLYDSLKSWRQEVPVMLGISIAFAGLMKADHAFRLHRSFSNFDLMVYLFLGLFIVVLAKVLKNLFLEIHFAKKFRKDSLENPNLVARDMNVESQTVKSFNKWFWLILVIGFGLALARLG